MISVDFYCYTRILVRKRSETHFKKDLVVRKIRRNDLFSLRLDFD